MRAETRYCFRRVASLLTVVAGSSLAWPAQLEARPRAMRFERLSIEQGLSQSVANCVLQDATGFLWIGTQTGLNRYDGYGFEVFRHDAEDPQSVAHDWILALAEGPAGDLWIATEGGGLGRWRRATGAFDGFRHDPADPHSLSSDRLVDLAWDRSGSLWIGTSDGGLNRYDPATDRFERFRHDPADPRSLADDQVRAVYEDRLGRLWLGTWSGLDLYDPQSRSFQHFRHDPGNPGSLSDDRVRAITEDRRGRLWVGTHAGLNRFDPRASGPRAAAFERFFHDPADAGSLSHDWVRSLLEDRDGRLWVGTDGGLNLWQEASAGFVAYQPDAADPVSLGNPQIVDLYQDRGGILWIGTLGGGVSKWNPGTWSFDHYWNDDEQASNMVFSVSEDSGGALWIGTFGGGLERLDRATGERRRWTHDPGEASGLNDDRVTALLHDRQRVLWVGTVSGGLSRFVTAGGTAGSFEHFRHDPARPDSLSANGVTALFEDHRGRLWVGTLSGGLNLHCGDGLFLRFRHDPRSPTSLGSDRVFALAEDPDGMLWLATDGAGLSRLHPATGAFLRIEHSPDDGSSLASNELLSVHVDAAGRLWAGSKASGLSRLEELDDDAGRAAFRHYTREQGLPDDTIWGIRSEPGGALWLATNNGLARLDPETGRVKSYNTSHGLQSNEFNQGAHSGELFFGGLEGLNAFFPDRIRTNERVPPVVLTGFTRFNEPLIRGRPLFDLDEIPLSYRDRFLTLEFAALDFTAPEKNRYRYRLEAIGDGAHRTAVTVKDLRSFARLDETELKVVDLHTSLDSTLTLLHHQTKDRIQVMKVYGSIPLIECYVGQLNQVFMNLLANAVQAIEGEGKITLTTAPHGADRICVSIRDSGMGMSEEVQKKIFDPFFTTKPLGEGTGLGLSISHGIVAHHGGAIEVSSEPGLGAELTVTLPVRQ